MGFRFRKSIKIAPGIKINVGKRGISSIGVGGFSFGSRGIYQNIGVPGTGISYRYKLAGTPKASSSHQQRRVQVEVPFKFALREDGTLMYLDKNGQLHSDKIVREIKRQQRDLILSWLQKQCDTFNSLRDSLMKIYINTPAPTGEIIVNPKPEPPKYSEYGLLSSFLASQKQKIDAQNKRIQEEYKKELAKWEAAEQALRTNVETMSAVLSTVFTTIQWPKETNVSFDITSDGKVILLDVDLPEIEDMPTQQANVNSKDLRLTIKDIPQSQIQLDYLKHIHAIGFRLAGDVFAYLPSICTVVFSAYSQRANKKTAQIENEYLYSVRVHREEWEKINFKNLESLDVVECFEMFEVNRKISSRGVIQPIIPFQN